MDGEWRIVVCMKDQVFFPWVFCQELQKDPLQPWGHLMLTQIRGGFIYGCLVPDILARIVVFGAR